MRGCTRRQGMEVGEKKVQVMAAGLQETNRRAANADLHNYSRPISHKDSQPSFCRVHEETLVRQLVGERWIQPLGMVKETCRQAHTCSLLLHRACAE